MKSSTPTEEIKRLKKQIKELKEKNQLLSLRLINCTEQPNSRQATKCSLPQYIYEPITHIAFEKTFYSHPVLIINHEVISFDKAKDSTCKIAEILFQPKNAKKLLSKKGATLDIIYEWFQKNKALNWFTLDPAARKQFEKNLYHTIRHINDKANAITDGQKLIFQNGNTYYMLTSLKFIKK